MADITFLAPGSCQLEVTAQGNVGTDTGVDLASVSWTIEQALIAGCRFSPSAGDVHIDRNGVLTIGRSLFDRINQSDGDENIPGQCTLIIRADSTITDNVLDRFKVLVGYPGEGGGGGGGEIEFVDVPLGTQTTPVVGGDANDSIFYPFATIDSMVIDGTEILNSAESGGTFVRFIVGSTVKHQIAGFNMSGAYVVTIDDTTESPTYGTVTTWSTDNYSTDDEHLTYTVPNLADDEHLVFVMVES